MARMVISAYLLAFIPIVSSYSTLTLLQHLQCGQMIGVGNGVIEQGEYNT